MENNQKDLWFRRKYYGWGWTPVKWQGWVLTLALVVFILWDGLCLKSFVGLDGSLSGDVMFWYFVRLAVVVAVFLFICYKKGEKPKWQWGLPSNVNNRTLQIVLLVMIIVGLLLLATQKLWVGSVVDFILKNY